MNSADSTSSAGSPAAAAAPTHVVAVIGGATAGAEVASRLAARGVQVVVFDMNPRPYGKIEDGLPRWHARLRQMEYGEIRQKLGRAGVHFVPNTKIGRDLGFRELATEWGFSSVVLASGAWHDRPLPVEGADAYIGKGLIYQNPFIIAFNHKTEPDFAGEVIPSRDGAIVVGGGLASIDVAKVLMLEVTCEKLAERGIEQELTELEVKGIPKTLAKHGVAWEELGIEGCTIFYRRRTQDMPLVEAPEDASPERIAKVEQIRERMLSKAMAKFCFTIEALCSPQGLLLEDDQLVGLRFVRNRMDKGRPTPTDETFERRASCVISSIGSIPEPVEGIAMRGELFAFEDWSCGRLEGFPKLFSVGNVVTGKGNILASRRHAAAVSEAVIERFLGLGDGHDGEEAIMGPVDDALRARADEIVAAVGQQTPLAPQVATSLLGRVRERQKTVGYGGDFDSWIQKNTPPGFV